MDAAAGCAVPGGLIGDWARSLRSASYVDMTAAQLTDFLCGLATTVIAAVQATPFCAEPGRDVGIALVRARLSAPASLSGSLTALQGLTELVGGRRQQATRQRMDRLMAAMSEGFAQALQQRILAEQESIQQATQRALLQAQQGWQRSQAELQAVFDGAATAIAVCTATGTLIQANQALAEMVGRPTDSLTGTALVDLIHPDDQASVCAAVTAVAHTDRKLRLEKRFTRPDGRTGWATLSISVVPAGGDRPASLVVVADDVTTQRQLQHQLRHQAHHDGLTGLPNRELLYQQLTTTLQQAAPGSRVGMFFVDLDEFKAINDTLGHGIGDRLLVAVADRLRLSLSRTDHFLVRYQPIVSLPDTRLRGAEALLRWPRPGTGTVSPNSFIPVAEQSGLIIPLGRWVLREACTRAASWQPANQQPGPFVSVNVSMRQCKGPSLVTDVTDALDRSGLAPTQLQLELTETAVMTPSDGSVATLRALANLDIRIVIDDFGTGYSNLTHLRHLPIHGLKLAGAFMAGIRAPATDLANERIVETVIRLAHLMNLAVTAEGVETPTQAARLTALGCDLAQGWHYGPAGPPHTIPAWKPANHEVT